MIPKLTVRQTDRLSEILGNLGLVFFASLVVPSMIRDHAVDIVEIVSGIATSLVCIVGSMTLLKRR